MDTAASSRLIAHKPLLLVQVWRGEVVKKKWGGRQSSRCGEVILLDMFGCFLFFHGAEFEHEV